MGVEVVAGPGHAEQVARQYRQTQESTDTEIKSVTNAVESTQICSDDCAEAFEEFAGNPDVQFQAKGTGQAGDTGFITSPNGETQIISQTRLGKVEEIIRTSDPLRATTDMISGGDGLIGSSASNDDDEGD